ncbi:uncharacterized protein [Aristolochia californica]|uniref:uncharacterized protein n=1 Tax=Aristolochia californica TaxID=171875 RepID=UPI0035D5EADA
MALAAASSWVSLQQGRAFFNAQKRNRFQGMACCRLGFNSSRQIGGPCLVADRLEENAYSLSFFFKGGDWCGRGNTVKDEEPVLPEMLDEWITESVTEIVKNVGDAPFLLQLYAQPKRGSKMRLEKGKAVAEWPLLQRRWREGSGRPQGVILVERLMDREAVVVEDDGSAYWGLLVQGRGLDCGACYILKTNRIQSESGFCTYFCLVRAKCFGESSDLQMRNSWLITR